MTNVRLNCLFSFDSILFQYLYPAHSFLLQDIYQKIYPFHKDQSHGREGLFGTENHRITES